MVIGASGKSVAATVTVRKTRSDVLTEEQITEVEKFYETDGISQMSPGRKDYVSIKTQQGKVHKQKRLLLMNIKEAYKLFLQEANFKICLAKFAELRPQQVVLMTARDQQVYICKYHENIDLLLEALSKKLLGLYVWTENVMSVE